MKPTESPSVPDPSGSIRIAPATAAVPQGVPTDVVVLQPGVPSPRTELEDNDAPRVRGYEILMVIGTGGMGIVYMARQCDLQRTVALKMLRGLGQYDSEYRERLKAEAETVAKLQHPNIIQVFEIGTVDSQPGETSPSPFISFEYVDGGSLMQHTETPQKPAFAAQIIEKLARAVHAAHRLGVIHRDLKPANVLLTKQGEPKVADFGLAKHFGNEVDSAGRYLTRAGVVMGTPAYMAPEQAAGDPISPAIDTYALGVILYELLTARVPFQGGTPVETMHLVRDQEPVSPRQLQPKLPRDLETICLKCLQKDPSVRYESAEALANDLLCWREGRPILARPVGYAEQTLRAARRNPTVAVLSLAVVLVTLAGVSGVIWKWQEALQHASAAEKAAVLAESAATTAQEATRSERWERYRSHLTAASNALQLNNVVAARQALDAAPLEFRNWEWHHFYQQLDGAQGVLRWPDMICDLTRFTPDGRWAVVDSVGGKGMRVWNVLERKAARTYPQENAVQRTKISDDGRTLVSFRPDHSLVVDDIATGRRNVLRGHTRPIHTTAFSDDGKRLTSYANDGSIRVWDVEIGEQRELIQFGEENAVGARFGPNLERLCMSYSDPKLLKLWEVKTRHAHTLHGEDHTSLGVDFNPSGTRLVAMETFPSNSFHLWDTTVCKHLATFRGHTNQLKALAFNTDNTRIVSASMDQTARIWDASSGKSIAILRDHKGWVTDVRFSPDGKQVLTASQDQTLRLWDATDGTPITVLRGHTGEIHAVTYAENGKSIVSGARDGTVRIWDAQSAINNGAIRGHTKFVYGVAFHPDGERVSSASWDGTVRVWNATSGLQCWAGSYGPNHVVSSVAFHPKGYVVASMGREEVATGGKGGVRLWDANTGEQTHSWDVPADWRDSRLAFSPNGELLAAGNMDGGIRLWDVNTKAQVGLLRVDGNAIRDLAFSPDGRLLASVGEDSNRGVKVWDVAAKSSVVDLHGHTGPLYAVTFSPDGKLLASGSVDGTVRLWDTTTWKELVVLKHGANVYSLAFNRDGTRLFTACADNTVRIWDMKTNNLVAELRGHTDYVHSIAFSPDGSRLITGSGDSTLRIWDTISPQVRNRPK
ncbi:MAG: hypothetical protein C0467_03990 [Planctomycetaceae bacterium]|nr:hypothetical protein [Planctomycetaceae bacterium]